MTMLIQRADAVPLWVSALASALARNHGPLVDNAARLCRSSATLGVLAPLSTLAGRLRQALSRSSLSAECALLLLALNFSLQTMTFSGFIGRHLCSNAANATGPTCALMFARSCIPGAGFSVQSLRYSSSVRF